MGKIGYGYGSEWHLMRLKANHPAWLANAITSTTGLKGQVEWLDFLFEGNKDHEILDTDLLKVLAKRFGKDEDKLLKAYHERWVGGGALNLDSVALVAGVVTVVEAKGHLGESEGGAYRPKDLPELSGKERIARMNALLEKPFVERYGVKEGSALYTEDDYYQFANRIMLVDFLQKQGIPCRLLYLLFLGAWDEGEGSYPLRFESATIDDWMVRYQGVFARLGIEKQSKVFNQDTCFMLTPVNGEAPARLYPVGANKDEE